MSLPIDPLLNTKEVARILGVQAPIVRGKKRCRMHGGAAGSGGQVGNRNALRHGRYTADEINRRKVLRALIRFSRNMAADLT